MTSPPPADKVLPACRAPDGAGPAWRCRNHALALDRTARIDGDPVGRHERLSPSAARIENEIATCAPDGRWWSVFVSRLHEMVVLEALEIELAVREIHPSTRAAMG